MIDFIKINVLGCDAQKLDANPLLEFKDTFSRKTGLKDTKAIAEYHHCKIIWFDSGMVLFSGSLHKMYNSLCGLHGPKHSPNGYNGNQFHWEGISFALQHLKALFGVPFYQMHILQIEYGVNLAIYFDPQKLIRGLLMHQGQPFEFRYKGYYAEAVHTDYIVKIYNKGNQYQMPIPTLRFEIKVLKMRCQQKYIGLSTVEDITPERLSTIFDYLGQQLDKVIYYDNTIKKRKLSKVDQNRLDRFDSKNYWLKSSRNERCKNKKILAKIIKENSQNLKDEIQAQIEKTGVRFHRLLKNKTGVRFHTSIYRVKTSLSIPRKCPIIGVGLEHEKKGAKYALTTTLRNLQKKDEKKFVEVCSLLLSKSYKRPKYETDIISHLAKQIRNRYYSTMPFKKIGHGQKKMYQPTLFDAI